MSINFIDKLPVSSKSNDEVLHFLGGITGTRRHAFATYNKYGLNVGDKKVKEHYLHGDINEAQYIGVDLELKFYNDYKMKLDLVPALDCGDKVDFVGCIKGRLVRIDVTSKKSLKDYKAYLMHKFHFVVEWNKITKRWAWFIADRNKKDFRQVSK